MSRYYFHQRIGKMLIEDPEGFEYPNAAAARACAVICARHLWAEAIIAGYDLTGESIEIADAEGCHIATVPLADALPFRLACAAACPTKVDELTS